MPDVNENMFVPGQKVNERPTPEDKAEAFLELQMREEVRRQGEAKLEKLMEMNRAYPYEDGDHTVLGPEIFTDGTVISWRGENYVPQSHVQALRDLRAVAGIHCGALLELLHDGGVRMPENALRIWQILYDELTLTIPALAENHPAVMPRIPEGME